MTPAQPEMQPESVLAEAIFRTLLDADVFSFPLTEAEIHHFLIGLKASANEVRTALDSSPWLAYRIERVNGFVCRRGQKHIIEVRDRRHAASLRLWPVARRCGLLLAHLPFVRMVALTGALAVRNGKESGDDIDYLLVTTPGRVWTARALAVLVVRAARLLRVGLCPNYVLAETALLQARRDLFTAHELAQMVPLAGFQIYQEMRTVNAWSDPMLPNACGPFYAEPETVPRGFGKFLQRLGERLLSGSSGDAIERWEQQRKLRKFAPQIRQPGSSAQLDQEHIKGHFNDYGYPALDRYYERLEKQGLVREQVPVEPIR